MSPEVQQLHDVLVGNDRQAYERLRRRLIMTLGYDEFRERQNQVFKEICTMPETTTKDTLHRYNLPSVKGEGWAIIVIDTNGGYFSTVSDWGNYAYVWSSPGGEFRKFLAGLNADYLQKKLMHGRRDATVYDCDATKEAVNDALKELKEDGSKKYDSEVELLGEHSLSDEEDFRAWCDATQLDEPWAYRCTRPEPQSWGFCTKIWPRFAAILRAELEKEEREKADTLPATAAVG